MEVELKRRRPDSRRHASDSGSPEFVIKDLWNRARYGSYFDCLGIAADVGTTDVREAWLRLSAMIVELRAGVAGNADWLQALEQIEKVASDGFEVLSDPDLRLAYIRALEK